MIISRNQYLLSFFFVFLEYGFPPGGLSVTIFRLRSTSQREIKGKGEDKRQRASHQETFLFYLEGEVLSGTYTHISVPSTMPQDNSYPQRSLGDSTLYFLAHTVERVTGEQW